MYRRMGCSGALFIMMILVCATEAQRTTFNVKSYGAVSDGKTDNSKAFLEAWKEACKLEGPAHVLVPSGNYLLKPVKFVGPCNGRIAFEIGGVLVAPADKSFIMNEESWINFRYVEHLSLFGGGTLDGQGAKVWSYNDCTRKLNCNLLPINLKLDFVKDSSVRGIHTINSKSTHVMIFGGENLTLANIKVSAPGNSPNTDGIKIGNSRQINITRTQIGTGDDCIALIGGSKDIHITKVVCGPGHGISIGSLGKENKHDQVEGVYVKNCTFKGTSNGIRIKTWATPYDGFATNLNFEDIIMENVDNALVIDQQYCPNSLCKQKGSSSNIQISDVTFRNIRGTSRNGNAKSFTCSKSRPCKNIVLENVNIKKSNGGATPSICTNVNGDSQGHLDPNSCLY